MQEVAIRNNASMKWQCTFQSCWSLRHGIQPCAISCLSSTPASVGKEDFQNVNYQLWAEKWQANARNCMRAQGRLQSQACSPRHPWLISAVFLWPKSSNPLRMRQEHQLWRENGRRNAICIYIFFFSHHALLESKQGRWIWEFRFKHASTRPRFDFIPHVAI